MSQNWSESAEKRIVLKESTACQNVFEVRIKDEKRKRNKSSVNINNLINSIKLTCTVQVFLKYLYTGKIQVD